MEELPFKEGLYLINKKKTARIPFIVDWKYGHGYELRYAIEKAVKFAMAIHKKSCVEDWEVEE